MKKIFFSIVAMVSLLVLAENISAQKNSENPPTAKEAIRHVLLSGNTPLDAAKNCSSIKTAESDRTILDLLSGVLAFQTEPDMKNSIEFTFKREVDRDQIIWVCDVTFRSGDEESPAANGFRFKLRNSDRKVVPGSMSCIGTT